MRYINNNLSIEKVKAQDIAKKFGTPTYCYSYSLLKENINNFKKNPNKASYSYHLTPLGASEKAKLAIKYLKCKMAEYKTLKQEIENVKSRINS